MKLPALSGLITARAKPGLSTLLMFSCQGAVVEHIPLGQLRSVLDELHAAVAAGVSSSVQRHPAVTPEVCESGQATHSQRAVRMNIGIPENLSIAAVVVGAAGQTRSSLERVGEAFTVKSQL